MAKKKGGAGAFGVHRTATSEAAWDGAANESRVLASQDEQYYRSAYAWRAGGAETKESHRYLHHEVNEAGEVGPANVTACREIIEMLNQEESARTLLSSRQGVYTHLATHLSDADPLADPPALRKFGPSRASKGLEQRTYPFEVRNLVIPDADVQPALDGYAAVFNRETVLIPRNAMWEGSPEIRELIESGAFTKTLTETDQRSVWNHNTDIVLGRRSNNTLTLKQDRTGLAVEILPPNTPLIRDMVIAPIDRGDVDQMSFKFWSLEAEIEEVDKDTVLIRQKEISLMEVSPVAIPAYSETSISARCHGQVQEFWQQRQAAIDAAESAATPEAQEAEPVPDHSESTSEPVPDHLEEEQTLRTQIELERVRSGLS